MQRSIIAQFSPLLLNAAKLHVIDICLWILLFLFIVNQKRMQKVFKYLQKCSYKINNLLKTFYTWQLFKKLFILYEHFCKYWNTFCILFLFTINKDNNIQRQISITCNFAALSKSGENWAIIDLCNFLAIEIWHIDSGKFVINFLGWF